MKDHLKHFLQDLIMDTENAIKGLFLKLKCFKKARVLVQFLLVVISHKLHIELKYDVVWHVLPEYGHKSWPKHGVTFISELVQ